ncbi:hypothetical protein [Leucothrix arctica]|uniref:Uncharacterized protein n=1 Tax=Leucothrix arctica TaxID=1481894 RepID=A0A317CC16_9GAMM|nr:hypothetical protein [Leucothrix arctica]PWQ94873.1 hypothetical protein DKT75_14065 [Leucothrix arctica]
MRKKASYFYPMPVDIKDALLSSAGQYSLAKLHRIAVVKGLMLSPELSRKELCERISLLPFSYKEFCALSDSLLSSKRTAKTETTKLNSSITEEDVELGAEVLKSLPNHSIKITRHQGSRIQIRAEYTEFDHKHTRLKQRVEREAVVNIIRGKDNKLVINGPDTEHTRMMVNLMVNQIKTETSKNPEPERIDLSSYNTREVNKFFLEFTKSTTGLQFKKAVDIKLKKAELSLGDEEEEEEEAKKVGAELLGNIKSASLSGDTVLSSPQVQEFINSGEYYIVSLRWETKPVAIENARPKEKITSVNAILLVEIKASPSSTRKNFSYDVLRYKPEKVSSFEYRKGFMSISSDHKAKYKTMLGEKAYELFARLKKSDEESVV